MRREQDQAYEESLKQDRQKEEEKRKKQEEEMLAKKIVEEQALHEAQLKEVNKHASMKARIRCTFNSQNLQILSIA